MKIVVRLPNWLGDIVMSIPFICNLQHLYPHAELYLIIRKQYQDLLQLFPFPVKVHQFERSGTTSFATKFTGILSIWQRFFDLYNFTKSHPDTKNPDIFVALPPSFSARMMGLFLGAKMRINYSNYVEEELHRTDQYLRLLASLPLPKSKTTIDFSNIKGNLSQNLSQDILCYLKGKIIVVNMNSEAPSRKLPFEHWEILIKELMIYLSKNDPSDSNDHNPNCPEVTFVFTGLKADYSNIDLFIKKISENSSAKAITFLNLSGRTTILDLIFIFQMATVIISNDSGPAHLAALVDSAPVAVFFGAGDAQNTAPIALKQLVLIIRASSIACSPCLKNICPHQNPNQHLMCLKQLDMPSVAKDIFDFI